MSHSRVFDIFKKKFTHLGLQVQEWFPNGKDSVRVRLHDRQELIFTYYGERRYILETKDNYMERMKGE